MNPWAVKYYILVTLVLLIVWGGAVYLEEQTNYIMAILITTSLITGTKEKT